MVLADIQTKYGLDHMGIVLFLHLTHIYLFTSLQPQTTSFFFQDPIIYSISSVAIWGHPCIYGYVEVFYLQ